MMSLPAADAEVQVVPQTCTQTEFARILVRSKAYVSGLGKADRLVYAADGLVDVQASLDRIRQTTGAMERAAPAVQNLVYASAQERERHYSAELKRLEYERETARVVEVAAVESALADALTRLRSRLESWPDILAPQIESFAGAAAPTRALLAEHIEAQLAALSAAFGAAARGQRAAGAETAA